MLCGAGVNHLTNSFHLTVLAVCLIGSVYDRLFQLRVTLLAPLHPLQQINKVLLCLGFSILQLFQRVQRIFIPAKIRKQIIQFTSGLGNKLRRCLIGWQLPTLTDCFQGRKVLALGNVIQDGCIEFPRRYG